MIAASKIKRAQKAVENNRPYSEKISTITERALFFADLEKFRHPYLPNQNDTDPETSIPKKNILVVISPDRGLCGSLNTNLFKKILENTDKEYYTITIGGKAEKFCARLFSNLIASFPMGNILPSYAIVLEITRILNELAKKGGLESVEVLYAQFKSIFSQEAGKVSLLPIQKPDTVAADLPYLFEPNIENVLSELLPYYLEVKLYSALIEAYTSEQAARMVAMQNAKNNARDIASFLTLAYNKSRQERITNEILAQGSAQ